MQLVRFAESPNAQFRPGLVREREIVDLSPRYSSIAAFLTEYPAGWRLEALNLDGLPRHKYDDVVLDAPVDDANQVYAVAANYKKHAEEAGLDVPPQPVIFTKPRSALVGPGQPIRLPPVSQQMDYEGELAVVIGRVARRVTEGQARDHVAGYTILNDVTARDLQWTQLGKYKIVDWLSCKALDRSTPVGPWIVSHSAIEDPHNLRLTTRLNDKIMQDSNTSLMVFSIWSLIEYLSARVTLRPGDILSTGTPFGVGGFREIFLNPGDKLRIELENIGVLENSVVEDRE